MRDLNDAIVARINQAYNLGLLVAADYDARTNSIGIKLSGSQAGPPLVVWVTFKLHTDDEITLPENRKRSVNGLLKNFTAGAIQFDGVYRSGFVDVHPLRNVYSSCSGLGNFNTMSVSGDRNIIQKIPGTAGFGEVIYYESGTGTDYLDCSHQTLSRISFQLKDVFGSIIDLNGAHISFPIVFSRVQDWS